MSDPAPMRVLIVDDEPLGRDRLVKLLEGRSDVALVGVAQDGPSAVREIGDKRPDLVFLDIQMPRMSGFEVIRRVGPSSMPATVFVTAHDNYAVQAFDLTAVDYLLKPYSDERFEEAFRRAKRRIMFEGLEAMREQLLVLLGADPPDPGGGRSRVGPYLERIAVPMRGRLRVVPVDEIDHLAASGVYVELHVGPDKHLVRESLQSLEDRLDPRRFVRIHRSHLVRIDRIDALLRGRAGSYEAKLTDGSTLPVGRTYRQELERRLGRGG